MDGQVHTPDFDVLQDAVAQIMNLRRFVQLRRVPVAASVRVFISSPPLPERELLREIDWRLDAGANRTTRLDLHTALRPRDPHRLPARSVATCRAACCPRGRLPRVPEGDMQHIGVIGAGTMGHGIAQVCAMAGCTVVLTDASEAALAHAVSAIDANLTKGVVRGKVTEQVRETALAGLRTGPLAEACDGADLLIEAVPEKLELKRALFAQAEALTPAQCVFGTNTSSLSVAGIAAPLSDPGRVIGTHFFNPVHIMALLEVIVAETTRPEVVDAIRGFGERIGKQVIVVRDVAGFATSRLGVALGMEAIRMVEQGVASPEDIDAAMVLGYRHPVGPLKLTDMVGLDVRMHIGSYLAAELGNPAFEPPALMRSMVAEGKLGKKTGQGFYAWPS